MRLAEIRMMRQIRSGKIAWDLPRRVRLMGLSLHRLLDDRFSILTFPTQAMGRMTGSGCQRAGLLASVPAVQTLAMCSMRRHGNGLSKSRLLALSAGAVRTVARTSGCFLRGELLSASTVLLHFDNLRPQLLALAPLLRAECVQLLVTLVFRTK